MTERNKTIVVIGAGASADFRKKIDSNTIAEIYRTDNQALDHPMQILKKPKGNSIAMPTGQELVNQMIGFGNEILEFGIVGYLSDQLMDCLKIDRGLAEKIAKTVHNKIQIDFNRETPQGNFSITPHYFCGAEDQNEGNNFYHAIVMEMGQPQDQTLAESINVLLAKLINDKINKKDFIRKIVKDTPLKNHLRLAYLLNFYDPESIDNFLNSIEKELIDINPDPDTSSEPSTKDELVKDGKELIAYFLLKAEDKEIFSADNFIWYRWLREAIINGHNDKKIENLEIISFNYDRSLAHYLESKMPNFSDKIKAKITYPYGSLSEAENSFKGFKYGELKEKQASPDFCIFKFFEDVSFKEMAKEIMVIGKEREKVKKKLENFKSEIIPKQTKRIYFLGFGFIAQNCNLFCSRPSNTAEVYYTNFDDSQKIRRSFESIFQTGEFFSQHYITSHRGVYEAIQKDFELKID